MTDTQKALDALDDMEANEYWRRGDFSENIEIIRAALEAKAVPEGYVLVPIEPTEGMLEEAAYAFRQLVKIDNQCVKVARIAEYKAMIKAAQEMK